MAIWPPTYGAIRHASDVGVGIHRGSRAGPVFALGGTPSLICSYASRSIRHQIIAVVVSVCLSAQLELLKVVEAPCAIGFSFGTCQCWQQHRCQDGDDRNNNQQLDQCETVASPSIARTLFLRRMRHITHLGFNMAWPDLFCNRGKTLIEAASKAFCKMRKTTSAVNTYDSFFSGYY